MSRIRFNKPSPAMAVSVIALFVALGGTGYAATAVVSPGASSAKAKKKKTRRVVSDTTADKKLIRSQASGLSVRFAKTAQNANNAVNATNAIRAQNASNANNASNLGGQPPSAYAGSARLAETGIVGLAGTAAGASRTVVVVGPFTISLTCTRDATNKVSASLDATSSEANSVIFGHLVGAAGTKQPLTSTAPSTTPLFSGNNVFDLEAPSGAQLIINGAIGTLSVNNDCWTNLAGVH